MGALVLFLLVACSQSTTPTVIERVEGGRLETRPNLDFTVLGKGFGLSGLRIDLDDGTGNVAGEDLSLRLIGAGAFEVTVPSQNITLVSSRRMDVRVRLATPPPVGFYGLSLLEGEAIIAEARDVLELVDGETVADAGVSDMGPAPVDAGPPDLGPRDTGVVADLGSPDTGLPDSGTPFPAGYARRRALVYELAAPAPAGVTLRVPIPHAQLVAAGQVRADAGDLLVYQGARPLSYQWEDVRKVGTDELVMVVALAETLPSGPSSGELRLYYDQPMAANAPTDGIFAYSQRFDVPPSPIEGGNPAAWFLADSWIPCRFDRSVDAVLPPGSPAGAICALDDIRANLVRQTMATPVAALPPLPGGQVYEMRLWLAGRFVDGPRDVLYFSHGADNVSFDLTTEIPPSDWSGLVPSAPLTFTDIDDAPRSVLGWTFPPDRIQWWREAVGRFNPMRTGGRSLHLRYISTRDSDPPETVAAVDDWTVRVALDPEPSIALGPEERP